MAFGKAIRAGQGFFELFADDSKLVRGLRNAQRRLRVFAKSAMGIGTAITGIGIAAATPFALSARTFATFESSMARVKALTGAVGGDFQKLEMKAKQLGASTVFSASQAAEAMGVFALAGYDVDQILASVGPALDLAAAGQLEIAEASDIAAKLMAGMGIEAKDLSGAIDIMTKAMTTANTDLQMLGEAFTYVGPIAKTAGISFEEITAAIQLLSNAGIQGEMAGTTLRGMILSLTAPSAEAADELERLGVAVSDGAGNVRPLADILGDLETALSGAGSATKLESLGTIFPARQAAGAAELVGQGAEALRDATQALQNSGGTAGRIAGTQLDTLKGDFIILLSALEGVAIAVGEAFGTQLRTAIKGVTAFLALLAQFIEQNQYIIVAMVAGIAAFTALGVAMVTLGIAVQIVSFALGGLALILSTVAAAGMALLSPLGLIAAAVAAAVSAFVGWGNVMNAVVDFVNERFGEVFHVVKATLLAMRKALANGDTEAAMKVMTAGLKVIMVQATGFITQKWNAMVRSMKSVWADVWYAFQVGANEGLTAIDALTLTFTLSWSDQFKVFAESALQSWYWLAEKIEAGWAFLQYMFADENVLPEKLDEIAAKYQAKADASFNRAVAVYQKQPQEFQDKLNAIEAKRQQTNKDLEEARMEAKAALADQTQVEKELALAKAAYDDAKAQWGEAFIDATKSAPGTPFADTLAEIKDAASGVPVKARSNSVTGGFNIQEIARSFGGNALDRTAKATEQIAKNTEKILNKDAKLVVT